MVLRCLSIGIILLTVKQKYDTIREEGNTTKMTVK